MAHYFTNDEVKSEIIKHKFYILDKLYEFYTDNGVFSKDKLDFGTRVFLENINIESINGDVLDVGCGYGPIGIVVSSLTNANVDMCDVNKRAIHLTELNIKLNNLKNISVFESDAYSNVLKKYDYILTNPPIRAGKEKVYEIVMGAINYLKENGTLYIVIRKDQGAKSMLNDLNKIYKTEVLAKIKGFFIIKCSIMLD